jgi:hypothetical protein
MQNNREQQRLGDTSAILRTRNPVLIQVIRQELKGTIALMRGLNINGNNSRRNIKPATLDTRKAQYEITNLGLCDNTRILENLTKKVIAGI